MASTAQSQAAEGSDNELGPFAKSLGLTREKLISSLTDDSAFNSLLSGEEKITNGLALELVQLKESENLSFREQTMWLEGVAGRGRSSCSSKTVHGKLSRVRERRASLLKSKQAIDVQSLLEETFELPASVAVLKQPTRIASAASATPETSSLDLASQMEFQLSQQKHQQLEKRVELQRKKSKNIQRKLTRRDQAFAAAEEAHEEELGEEKAELKRKHSNEQHRVYYFQRQVASREERIKELEEKLAEVRHLLKGANSTISVLEADLCDTQEELEDKDVLTMESGKYLDEIWQCCLELLSLNVGVWNVVPVIQSVLRMIGRSADRLPSVGLLSKMLIELKQISSMHVAEELMEEEHTTLHSDGTSKFGHKYGSYQVRKNWFADHSISES